LSEFFFSHLDGTNSSTHTEDLLKLELNGALEFLNFIFDFFVFSNGDRELADLGQDITEQLGDLLHQRFRSDQDVVGLAPLLNELLILVELLQTFDINVTNTELLGLFTMDSSSEDTNLKDKICKKSCLQIYWGRACWAI